MPARKTTELIIIHCSATKPDMDIGADWIRAEHKKQGWSDIGYHTVIRRNGKVEGGRTLNEIGAHAKGHNSKSVGICMVGGIDAKGKPDCNFTEAQWDSLASEVSDMLDIFPNAKVIGHRDVSDKACPCFDAAAWWSSW